MTCDNCNQPATVFFLQIADGKTVKTHLCARCAEERGVTDVASFSLADALLAQPQQAQPDLPTPTDAGAGHCPSCGFTLEDLRKTQRLGCSACYGAFCEQLMPMLRNIHEATRHRGKLPAGIAVRQRLDDELMEARIALERAIAEESYERAAELRDRIGEIKQELEHVADRSES